LFLPLLIATLDLPRNARHSACDKKPMGTSMAKLIVVTRDGTEHEIEGDTSLTVMENIRDAGFDELLALCGGCCSCATCHVHIEGGDKSAIPAMSEDENDLLDSTTDRDGNSRLSCQIPFSDALDGLRVRIAAED